MTFVELTKAFDTVSREGLWKSMAKYGCPTKFIAMVRQFHDGALWFILRGDLLYVLPCAILFLWFSVLLALPFTRLGKRELILALFVSLIDLCLFGFVGFLFLLMSGKGCGL